MSVNCSCSQPPDVQSLSPPRWSPSIVLGQFSECSVLWHFFSEGNPTRSTILCKELVHAGVAWVRGVSVWRFPIVDTSLDTVYSASTATGEGSCCVTGHSNIPSNAWLTFVHLSECSCADVWSYLDIAEEGLDFAYCLGQSGVVRWMRQQVWDL